MAVLERIDPPMYVYEIPVDVIHRLSNTLDVDKGWVNLAAECGYDYDQVKKFELEYLRPHRSPTESMLQDWGFRNHTIYDLYNKLKKVQRIREMKLLEPLLLGRRRSSEDAPIPSISRQSSTDQPPYSQRQPTYSEEQPHYSQGQFLHLRNQPSNELPQQFRRQSSRASSVSTNLDAGQQASGTYSLREIGGPATQRQEKRTEIAATSSGNTRKPGSPSAHLYASDRKKFGDNLDYRNNRQAANKLVSKVENYANSNQQSKTAAMSPDIRDTAVLSTTQQREMNDTLMAMGASRNKCQEGHENLQTHLQPVLSRPKLVDYSVLSMTPDKYAAQPTEDRDMLVAIAATTNFTYKELSCATNGFSDNSKIGEGAFGDVYVGVLKQTKCAIKRLKQGENMASDDDQLLEHATEIKALLRFRHENIVQLYGFCVENGDICLVYQFMENGSLEDRLQCSNGSAPLTWPQRFNIIVGAACGLQYLHTVQRSPLVHGDVKSANVLLDRYFEAKLADFGLAQCANSGTVTGIFTHVTRRDMTERVYGTRAYLPPEFFMSGGTASVKSDCFGFGVILLEVCSGEKAYDERREPDKFLADYCETIFDDRPEADWLLSLQDPKAGYCPRDIILAVLSLAQKCIDEKPQRPEMIHVFQKLRLIHEEFDSAVGRKVPLPAAYDASASYSSLANFGYVNQMGEAMTSLSQTNEAGSHEMSPSLSLQAAGGDIPEALELQMKYDQQQVRRKSQENLCGTAQLPSNCRKDDKRGGVDNRRIPVMEHSEWYDGAVDTCDSNANNLYGETWLKQYNSLETETTEGDGISDLCRQGHEIDNTNGGHTSLQRGTWGKSVDLKEGAEAPHQQPYATLQQLYNAECSREDNICLSGVECILDDVALDSDETSTTNNTDVLGACMFGGSMVEPSIEHSVTGSVATFQSCPSRFEAKMLDRKMGDFFRGYMNTVREMGEINEGDNESLESTDLQVIANINDDVLEDMLDVTNKVRYIGIGVEEDENDVADESFHGDGDGKKEAVSFGVYMGEEYTAKDGDRESENEDTNVNLDNEKIQRYRKHRQSKQINNLAKVQLEEQSDRNTVGYSLPYNINASRQTTAANRTLYSLPYNLPRNITFTSNNEMSDTDVELSRNDSSSSLRAQLSEENNDVY